MAESAAIIPYLIDSLGQFVTHHVKLISDARDEVEQLTADLNYLNAFLKCVSRKKFKDDELKHEYVRLVRNTVYDAEVVVDTFITQRMSFESMNWFRRLFTATVKLDHTAQKVQKARKEVARVYGDKTKLDLLLLEIGEDDDDDDETGQYKKNKNKAIYPDVGEKYVVSVEDDANQIIGYLKQDTQRLDMICIVGMPGLGKSTLAEKIFRDPSIEDEFPKRIWVNVSKFTPKEVLLSILKEVIDMKELINMKAVVVNMKDTINMREVIGTEDEGGESRRGHQKRGKLLRLADKMHSVNELMQGKKANETVERRADEMQSMDEDELGKKVKGYLENGEGKLLIVMDDVWMGEDWKSISRALPTSNRRCKILITSRDEQVALSANRNRQPFKMRHLSKAESIKLLQYKVFGEPVWKPEFKDHGEIIADKCKGLPLAIVVMGGIIRKRFLTIKDYAAKVNAWNEFSGRVKDYLIDDPDKIIEKVISLSYDSLPDHLRACFLYFGMFPEDVEIPTRKLFEMWIAEGFVQEKPRFSREETAERYLDELIIRSLVTTDKTSFDGKAKTVRIHDTIRAFCLNKAGREKENFLEEITKSSDGHFVPLVKNNNSHRRLSIHSNILQFISSKPHGPKVRSFVCVSEESSNLESNHISVIPRGFKLLRVLDMKPITYPKLPSNIYALLHLRYIHLSFDAAVLPPSFSKLWNIQTLIVNTSRRKLKIKADIWKMRHLRHLKTNSITTLPKPTRTSSAQGENIMQTLGKMAPENFTGEVVDRAYNVRRLTIRGKLNMLLTSARDGCSIDNMAKLSKLEELKLENDVFPLPPVCPLEYFPPRDKFPPKLRMLTLSNTFLDWSQMGILASLDNLKVLKLKYRAFMGDYWETVDGRFRNLEVLFIGVTDLVVWKSSAGHFPALVHLELQYCEYLREIPIEFVKIPSFKALGLNHCPYAVASAKEIERQKKKAKEIEWEKMENDTPLEFKLTIKE